MSKAPTVSLHESTEEALFDVTVTYEEINPDSQGQGVRHRRNI